MSATKIHKVRTIARANGWRVKIDRSASTDTYLQGDAVITARWDIRGSITLVHRTADASVPNMAGPHRVPRLIRMLRAKRDSFYPIVIASTPPWDQDYAY